MQDKPLTFGSFVEQKRKAREYTLRGFAESLSIAAPYMCDIERDRRYPPEKKLVEISELLKLSEEEKAQMYDLAAMAKERTVSADLADYIMENDMLRVALRRAKSAGFGNKDWEKIAKNIKE